MYYLSIRLYFFHSSSLQFSRYLVVSFFDSFFSFLFIRFASISLEKWSFSRMSWGVLSFNARWQLFLPIRFTSIFNRSWHFSLFVFLLSIEATTKRRRKVDRNQIKFNEMDIFLLSFSMRLFCVKSRNEHSIIDLFFLLLWPVDYDFLIFMNISYFCSSANGKTKQ